MPRSKIPDVRVKSPVTVASEPSETPPEPFKVRLLILPVNTEAGNVSPVVLVKASEPASTSRLPIDRVKLDPEYLSELLDRSSVPAVSIREVPIFAFEPRITEPEEVRFIVSVATLSVVPGVV